MTSIERTAYPQFRRLTSARVLHLFFTPTAEEIAWARERTAGPESLFALVLALKCFQKMARFRPLAEIPEAATGHVRRCLGLDPEAVPDHGAARTAKWHRSQVRCTPTVWAISATVWSLLPSGPVAWYMRRTVAALAGSAWACGLRCGRGPGRRPGPRRCPR